MGFNTTRVEPKPIQKAYKCCGRQACESMSSVNKSCVDCSPVWRSSSALWVVVLWGGVERWLLVWRQESGSVCCSVAQLVRLSVCFSVSVLSLDSLTTRVRSVLSRCDSPLSLSFETVLNNSHTLDAIWHTLASHRADGHRRWVSTLCTRVRPVCGQRRPSGAAIGPYGPPLVPYKCNKDGDHSRLASHVSRIGLCFEPNPNHELTPNQNTHSL